jgi:hypothetical protein
MAKKNEFEERGEAKDDLARLESYKDQEFVLKKPHYFDFHQPSHKNHWVLSPKGW